MNQTHTNMTNDKMWLPVDGSDASKVPSGKGKRLIVLNAGNRTEGLIEGCDLVFIANSKDGDYHQEMNGIAFLNWFENQLMPALKKPSVVVLDNAIYHNMKTEDTVCPNFSKKKEERNCLVRHIVAFTPNETKKILYEKIKLNKTPVVYKKDMIANHHGQKVLRTPVRHCELNLIESFGHRLRAL